MKKTNLSWVGALLVFALLLWCTAATPVSYTHLDVYKRQG